MPFESNQNIFDLLPAAWQRPYFKSVADDTYTPLYFFGKLNAIHIPDTGVGGLTEAMSHELAHMIDHGMRGNYKRLLRRNYGMSFAANGLPKDIALAQRRELQVVAVQCHIFRLAGFKESVVIDDAMARISDALGNLALFSYYSEQVPDFDRLEYCKKKYEKLDAGTISDAWQSILSFLDNLAIHPKRRALAIAA